MKKHYIFSLAFTLILILSFGQTIEEVKKLGLTDSQLRVSFEKRQILLTKNSSTKTKKIKEGAFARIKIKGDSAKSEVILEAFLTDTIIVSSLKPQLMGKQIRLEFTEFRLIPIKGIESIEYSVRHRSLTYWTGFVTYIVGFELIFLPTIMPLILGNADEIYSQPSFPYTVASGVVIFFVGRKILKSLKPKEYNLLTDYDYRVVKK